MSQSLKEVLRRFNHDRLRRRGERLVERTGEDRDYARWVDRHDHHRDPHASHGARLRRAQQGPLISVLVPVFNPEPRWLDAAIDSVCSQVYERWELCIADDHSTDPRIRRLLEARAAKDPRIRVTFRTRKDWNPELFRGHNVFSHLGVYRTDLCRRVGGFRIGFEGSQDYDLALRCADAVGHDRIVHIPHILYHWRLHESSTSTGGLAKPYAMETGRRALQEHLLRCSVNADVVPDLRGWYCIDYKLPQPAPHVVVVILNGAGDRHLRKCRALLEATEYPNFRIADAVDADAFGCNDAVGEADDAEFVALVDSRGRAYAADWLRRLVSHAVQHGVAAVGPKLINEQGRVEGAGVVLGVGGSYGHRAGGIRADAEGYCGRGAIAQNVTALDEGCLVVRRSIFRHLCGIHPTYVDLSVGVVDFTLRLGAYGYVNRWVPSAWLSRKAQSALRRWFKSPSARACRKRLVTVWDILGINDPAYNPNLGLGSTHLTAFAHPPRLPTERVAMPD